MECCFCEEYANPSESQYYDELGKKINVECRILIETENWYAIPTLGCLTAGYVLLVCKQHYLSLATLNERLYLEMLELKKRVEKIIYKQLGYPCLAFEHGATNSCYSGANSVDHVHLHIVPFPRIIWPDLAEHNELENFSTVKSYEDLFAMWRTKLPETYLLFQDIDKTIYYKPDAKGMSSQLFRKCIAPYIDISQWDWKQEYYQSNFIKTLEMFRK